MKRNSVEIRDAKEQLRLEARGIVEKAKTEVRELTEAEQARIDEIKEEQKALDEELQELEKKRNDNPSATPDENENKENQRSMKQNFSILNAIRQVVDGQPLDATTRAMIEAGREEMRGMSVNGQIQLPVEKRAITITGENGEHDDVVSTDLFNVLEPLQHKLALREAGAKFLTGLVGDVQYPIMSNGAAAWEGETTEADDANISFSNVKLQPKRLSATIEVSKQFILQDSVGAENAIRNEIVNAIAQKLEATILGNGAGSATQPAGLFNGVTATAANFADICEIEAEVEAAKFNGEKRYILSPSAKASLRGMIKGTNATGMVYENGEVDGTPAISTGFLTNKQVLYGQFDQFVIGQWGAIDITVDPYTKAKNATIVLTVCAWFDAKALRSGAIKAFTLGTASNEGTQGAQGAEGAQGTGE